MSAPKTLYTAQTINEILISHGTNLQNKIAITIIEKEAQSNLTYDDLLNKSLAAANLIAKETKQGDRVLLVMPTSVEMVVTFFGCLLAGRIAVPLPVEKSRNGMSRLKSVVSDCAPALIIVRDAADWEKIKADAEQTPFQIFKSTMFSGAVKSPHHNAITNKQVAFIQYTSGSTSSPKGVALTHENLIANIKMIQKSMRITSDERVVSWLPLHHDMGLIGNLLTFVCCGAFTAIYPYQEFARSPNSWLQLMSQFKATLSGAPTFAFELINRKLTSDVLKNLDLSAMRLLYCGSERLIPEVLTRFFDSLNDTKLSRDAFFPCYGMAEASLFVSGRFCRPENLNGDNRLNSKYPTCGYVASNLNVQVVNESKTEIEPGAIGEIRIKGQSVTHGYWKEIKNSVSSNGELNVAESWLDTGDLGFLTGEELVITGRKKDIIKFGGRSIFPEDLEIEIEKIDKMFAPNSVVVVSDDNDEGKIIVIVDGDRNKRSLDFEDAKRQITRITSESGLPKPSIYFLAPLALPKTTSGKKQRQLTKQMLYSRKFEVVHEDSAHDVNNLSPATRVATHSDKIKFDAIKELAQYLGETNLNLAEERRSLPADFLLQANNLGLMKLLVRQEFGGLELSSTEFASIAETLGRLNLSIGAVLGIHNTLGVLSVQNSKNQKLKEKVLNEVSKFGSPISFALSEESAGSNPHAIEASAKFADGKGRLSGKKIWIGNAQYAKHFVVFANEFDNNGKNLGISGFLVPRFREGVEVGEEQLTVGMRSMPQCTVEFSDVIIADDDRLTEVGKGLELAFPVMEYARFGLACVAVGVMKETLGMAINYSQERKIWTGRLSENGYVRKAIVEAQLRTEALKKFTEYCAREIDKNGQLTLSQSLVCKILAGEWAFNVTDMSMQLSGGRGYTENFGIGRYWRDIRLFRIFEGPTEALAYQLGALFNRNSKLLDGLISDRNISQRLAALKQKYSEVKNKDNLFVELGLLFAECAAFGHLSDSAAPLINKAINRFESNVGVDIEQAIVSQTKRFNDFESANLRKANKPLFETWDGKLKIASSRQQVSVINVKPEVSAHPISVTKTPARSENAHPIAADPKFQPLDIQFRLETWLREALRIKKIDINTSLSDYGVDSLMSYELMCFIDEIFKIKVNEEFIRSAPTLKGVIDYIMKEVEKPNVNNLENFKARG